MCLSSISLGLSVSKPLMALGLFGLLIVWLVDGNYKAKIKAFWDNKTALILSSIYLITILGLANTSNFEFALDDLRRKLPLFFIPFYVAGFSPITKKELHLLLKIFIVGVLISSLWSLFVYLGGLNITIVDKRYLSRFNSHIRFGLAIALAIFFSLYYFIGSKFYKTKLTWLAIAFWLTASLFIFSFFTGLAVFVTTGLILLLVFGIRNKKKIIKYLSFGLFIGVCCFSFWFINTSISDFKTSIVPKTIEEKLFSKAGNKYQNDEYTQNSTLKENGYFIEKHIAWGEFQEAWNARSAIKFKEKDLRGQQIKNTLMRFVTSKGQRKDKEAIDQLSDKEVHAIENGIANYKYLEMNPLRVRAHKILWEYNDFIASGNLNGHSVLMRWEYWKTAYRIIKQSPIFGVGTGDVQDSFNKQYNIDNSTLLKKYRLRTHNQYLAYFVSFGFIGFLLFIFSLFYALLKLKSYKNYLYLAFFSIVFLSMIWEDTLEVQAGINFFAFFNTILLLKSKKPELKNEK